MELNQLRYFQTVARMQSVTGAAQALFISQSTLSQCLSRLEEAVGCPLFLRQRGKRLQLNDAGRHFLAVVDQVLAQLDEGVMQTRDIGSRERRQVSVAVAVHDLCDAVVLDYLTEHPDARIAQKLVGINSVTGLLLDETVDFAITPCPLSDDRLACRPLYCEELLLAVGEHHPLVGRGRVRCEELLGEHFICNFAEADRYFLEMLFPDRELDVVMESNEPATIRTLIERETGVAFLPARVVRRNVLERGDAPERYLRISDHRFDLPTCASHKKTHPLGTAAAALFAYTAAYCIREQERVHAFLNHYYA